MTPRGGSRSAACTPSEARARRNQSRAFLDVADQVLTEPATESETQVAAALAVLAAIAAADAICGLKLGSYHRGADHQQAATLLETVDLVDTGLPAKLRRILAAKDSVHYSPHLIAKADAQRLVRQARALVEAAESL